MTAPLPAGGGAKVVNVVADVAALRPPRRTTTASSPRTATDGQGRRPHVQDKPQPLGLSLAATPNPVGIGKPTVLAGTLSGTGNAGRQVVLQSNPFPYTQGFQPTSNIQLTGRRASSRSRSSRSR